MVHQQPFRFAGNRRHELSEKADMIITLPLPHKHLSPNSRCHWRAKAEAVKAYRTAAVIAAYGKGKPRWDAATVQCRFFFRDKRRRDGDNLLASTKPIWDGLVDAGVFSDDSGLTHLPVVQDKDTKNPRVEIHILSAN
jgi:crossover junction endodeoxyribonuclease RusA